MRTLQRLEGAFDFLFQRRVGFGPVGMVYGGASFLVQNCCLFRSQRAKRSAAFEKSEKKAAREDKGRRSSNLLWQDESLNYQRCLSRFCISQTVILEVVIVHVILVLLAMRNDVPGPGRCHLYPVRLIVHCTCATRVYSVNQFPWISYCDIQQSVHSD